MLVFLKTCIFFGEGTIFGLYIFFVFGQEFSFFVIIFKKIQKMYKNMQKTGRFHGTTFFDKNIQIVVLKEIIMFEQNPYIGSKKIC